jgi:hypothetical protein
VNRRLLLVVACLSAVAAGVAVARARADGPPQGVAQDGTGIVSPDGKFRYFTIAQGRNTLLEAVTTHGGTLWSETLLRGRFAIPAIAWTPTGMTPDGKTLVLTTNPWLGHAATFLVLSVPGFETKQVVTLHGSWSYDAISPRARTLYLIQSLTAGNANRYLVRAYDLRGDRLVNRVIADRRESGPMTGSPVTRATTRDGRWAYTLYTRGDGTAFVHALDTVHLAAVCVDLPWKDWGGWSVAMWVSRDGGELHLRRLGNGGGAIVLDTRDWKARVA